MTTIEKELESALRTLNDGFECTARYCDHETSERHYIVEVSMIVSIIQHVLDSERKQPKKVQQYQCQSYVENGKVINCSCGKCF